MRFYGKITGILYIKCFKIGIFQWNPFISEIIEKIGIPSCDPLDLHGWVNIDKDGTVIVFPQIRIHGIGAFNDGHSRIRQGDPVSR